MLDPAEPLRRMLDPAEPLRRMLDPGDNNSSDDEDEGALAITIAAERVASLTQSPEQDAWTERTRGLLRLMRHSLSCGHARGHANATPCHVRSCPEVSAQLKHVGSCTDPDCQVDGCQETALLMRHHLVCWNAPAHQRCAICAPVCEEAGDVAPFQTSPPVFARPMPLARPDERDAPDAFRCPVTGRVMCDCVMLVNSGESYERQMLLRELELRPHHDPRTQARFEDRSLIAENRTLERAIAHWRANRNLDSGGHGVAPVPPDPGGEPVKRQCSTCNKFKTQFQMRGDGSLLKTCDSCRLRARGYYTSRRKRKVDDPEGPNEDTLRTLAGVTPPAPQRQPPPTGTS
jgi:hypothetical protein